MYKKILIPLENSPADQTIIDHIRTLNNILHAQLLLVHVADGYAARLQSELNLAESEEIRQDRQYLDTRAKELIQDGFEVKANLVCGEPPDQILTLAQQEQCDLIAMATHGHKFLSDMILGSVADNIRHRTNIPILMIRSAPDLRKGERS